MEAMSDLERVLTEAQQAREQAEAAARRAEELEQQAQAARERERIRREERRRQWAQRLIDSYDADIGAADAAIIAAQEEFNRVSVENPPDAVAAYLAWGEATIRHYVLQHRVSAAAPLLGFEASPPEYAAPPNFSDALDAALTNALAERAQAAHAEVEAELIRLLNGEDEPPAAPETAPAPAAAEPTAEPASPVAP